MLTCCKNKLRMSLRKQLIKEAWMHNIRVTYYSYTMRHQFKTLMKFITWYL